MKQHITWDQFTQLSYKQVSRLQILINQKYHLIESEEHWDKIRNYTYTFKDGTVTNIHTSYIGFLKKLNIGKMIEILKTKHTLFSVYNDESENKDYGWWVVECGETFEYSNEYKERELVDALWEAIKFILQKCHKLT